MIECAVHTGILFSRKPCGRPATIRCRRCNVSVCKEHFVPQQSGWFLCPQCNRYENDNDHDWRYSDRGWQPCGRDESPATVVNPVQDLRRAVPAALDEQDKEGFIALDDSTVRAVMDAGDAEADRRESDFDAS